LQRPLLLIMRLEIKNGAAKFETIREEIRKNIESELDTTVSKEDEMLVIGESYTLYKVKGAIFFERGDKDLLVDVRVKSKPADNFTLYLILAALLGLLIFIGVILFPIILWLLEESERKKAETELGKTLVKSVKYTAEKQKLEVR